MASVKSMIAASLLAAPCADAFVAPGASQSSHAVTGLRGSTAVKAESSFSTYSALAVSATTGAAVLSFVGAKKPAARKTVACRFSPEAQIGVTEPLGFFDPAGFCKDEASFKDLRAKEIKHGRLAMMGALGMLTQSLVQLPGMEGVPKDISAYSTGAGQTGFFITIAIIAVLEATSATRCLWLGMTTRMRCATARSTTAGSPCLPPSDRSQLASTRASPPLSNSGFEVGSAGLNAVMRIGSP